MQPLTLIFPDSYQFPLNVGKVNVEKSAIVQLHNQDLANAAVGEPGAAITVAKSNFRKGGANLPVCRGARQGTAHLFGNYFWQSL